METKVPRVVMKRNEEGEDLSVVRVRGTCV